MPSPPRPLIPGPELYWLERINEKFCELLTPPTEYAVVSRDTPERLNHEVIIAMRDGWRCQGGVSVARLEPAYQPVFAQAMVR